MRLLRGDFARILAKWNGRGVVACGIRRSTHLRLRQQACRPYVIGLGHNVITVENRPRAMPGYLHSDSLRHTRVHKSPDGGTAKVMPQHAGHLCRTAGRTPRPGKGVPARVLARIVPAASPW